MREWRRVFLPMTLPVVAWSIRVTLWLGLLKAFLENRM